MLPDTADENTAILSFTTALLADVRGRSSSNHHSKCAVVKVSKYRHLIVTV